MWGSTGKQGLKIERRRSLRRVETMGDGRTRALILYSAGAVAAEYLFVAMATNGGRAMASTERDTDPSKEDEMLVVSPDRISGERTGLLGTTPWGLCLWKTCGGRVGCMG